MIAPFYEDVFGWRFVLRDQQPWQVFEISDDENNHVGFVEEVPEEIRGQFSYWMPCFKVISITDAVAALIRAGGKQFAELGNERVLASDAQGAHFMLSTR